MTTRKKLIEVALPLAAINKACAREKSIRHGHPSTLHLWWARRPLAAARAVIFSQMVDDPSTYVDVLRSDPKLCRKAESALKTRMKLWEEARTLADRAKGTTMTVSEPGPAPTLDDLLADLERQRLFKIIEDLVLWENTTNETVLQAARDEIWQSWRRTCAENADHPRAKELFDRQLLPAFHDPFAGGGTLPLEAQRLGLESHASDLNPVAVLINKAMIEISPRFAGKSPVNPDSANNRDLVDREWLHGQGLAEDVRYYGKWMCEEAEKRIGHLYPKVTVTESIVQERPELSQYEGQSLTVIAWIWARTVRSPNPAYANVDVPLISTYILSSKPGKGAYVEPVVEDSSYHFTVKSGKPDDVMAAKKGTKLARGANFSCLMSGTPIEADYVKRESKANRMGVRLMAIVAEGKRGRVYLAPTQEHEAISNQAKPDWVPDVTISGSSQYLGIKPYGIYQVSQLHTDRQLVALTTFSELVGETRERILYDSLGGDLADDGLPLREGGSGATAYAEALGVYLACGISRSADFWSNLCIWANQPKNELVTHLFGRQAIPMAWDFGEVNPFSSSGGNFIKNLSFVAKGIDFLAAAAPGHANQNDAATSQASSDKVVSTDPPYYDNVPYADLSDYFYVWLRKSLRQTFPELFATLAVPKLEELVAFAYRHENGRVGAESFFLRGMTQAMQRLAEQSHPAFPVSIYYAFKQTEGDGQDGTTNTGWDTFLAAVIESGFAISGTWPMRTERPGRMRDTASNALASSIILVCRQRSANAPTATRRELIAMLKAELPKALANLQASNIAPVDLAQAAIGPGMAVYTRFARVLDADGEPIPVRAALALINQTLDEALAEQEGDFDVDTRWALTWFEQSGFAEDDYGVAEQLSKSKNTSVAGLVEAGILVSRAGKVRLFTPAELPSDWDPTSDTRLTVWEMVHHLIRVLDADGEKAAATLVVKLGSNAETARELCYRLYNLCERKKRPTEALAYNSLVQSWPEITRLAQEAPDTSLTGTSDLFD